MNFDASYFVLILTNLFSMVSSLGIIGGAPVAHYSFFVSIKVYEKSCGGTLVAPDVVVTAAWCLFYEEKRRFAHAKEIDVFKRSDRTWPNYSTRYSCIQYDYHGSFDPTLKNGFGSFDLAVIKLGECIDVSKPENSILQPCSKTLESPEGFAIGTGFTRLSPLTHAESLMEVRLFKVSPCKDYLWEFDVEIDEEKQVCYGSRSYSRHAATCQGDFGGPIVHKNKYGTKPTCLIGIASFNPHVCQDPMAPSVFVKVAHFAELIEESISLFSMTPTSAPSCTISK